MRIKIGQVWQDNDLRGYDGDSPRKFRVVNIRYLGDKVDVVNLENSRHSTISLRLLKSGFGKRGYRLLQEPPLEDEVATCQNPR